MAIASVGTLGTSVGSTGASTFVITTATNALAAGDFAIFCITTDNISTTDGVTNDHKSITNFSGAGYWTKISEQTNTVGGAQLDGVCVSLWLFEATGAISAGATATLTLSSAAAVDKVAAGWKFTKAAGAQIALDTAPATNPVNNTVDANSAYGSVAFSGLASAARLYVRALGKEASTTTAITPSTSFTVITGTRSRNNASAVYGTGEFRINTSTGETSNPTQGVTGDAAGVFAALIEVTASDPTTLTDNFDDNSKDATKWGTDGLLIRNGIGVAGSITEANARTEVTPPTSASGGTGRKSLNYFDMTGKRIYARVNNTASWPAGEEAYIGCGWNIAHSYAAVLQSGTDVFVFETDVSTNASAAGVFSDGMWLGLRHNVSDDTMHVETAPAAENPPVTWTDQAHETRDQRAPIKAVLLGLGVEFWNAGSASPIVVYFDGFNTATTSGTSVALTGQSLTGAVGSVLAAAALALSGGNLTAARGSVQQGAPITGQAVSAAQGSSAASVTIALTGQSLSVAQGTVLQGAPIVGQSAAVVQGSAAPVTSIALTGQTLSAAQGSTVSTAAPALTGQAAVVAQGSLAQSSSVALSGQPAAVARGTVAPTAAPALTGIALVAARGSVNAGADATAALTGQSIAVAQGSIASSTNPALTGQALNSSRGAIVGSVSIGVTGLSSVAAAGVLNPSLSLAFTGLAISVARGTVTVGTTDVTAALTGQSLTSARGSVAALLAPTLTGQALASAQATLTAAQSLVLNGYSLTLAQSDLATRPSVTYPLAGIPQPYPGTPASYPLTTAQAYPLTQPQTYPLEGIPQQYPLAS